jgi:nicotinamidase/pyrazinamidase
LSGSERRILWDVDTQFDFVDPAGKLYVPGAERLRPAMGRLVAAARAAGLVHVASADDHEPGDAELSDEPDWTTTYPPHCLHGTLGAEKVSETRQEHPAVLPHMPRPAAEVAALVEHRREVLVPKKRFDVFSNPNTSALVEALDPSEVVLFGVATDVCNDQAVRGLLAAGRHVSFVEDAAAGIDPARTEAALREWRARGVRFTTVDEAVTELRA